MPQDAVQANARNEVKPEIYELSPEQSLADSRSMDQDGLFFEVEGNWDL